MAQKITELLGTLGRGIMGHGSLPPKERFQWWEIFFSYLEITRPFLLVMAAPIAGCAAVLAAGSFPCALDVVAGGAAVILATAGIHTFNDWNDRVRDRKAWPNRPIPAGRIAASTALAYALGLMAASLVLTVLWFNGAVTLILSLALVLGMAYCMWLRDWVGYLSLPPIIALFPLGGWAAFSPDTFLTDATPWTLALLVVFWQGGHIMVHSPGHPIVAEDGKLRTEKKAFFYYPTPRGAASLGILFLVLTFAMSVWLYATQPLGWIYLACALPVGLVTLAASVSLLGDPTSEHRSMVAFNAASVYLTAMSGGIVVDRFLTQGLGAYFHQAWQLVEEGLALVVAHQASLLALVRNLGAVAVVVGSVVTSLGLVASVRAAAARAGRSVTQAQAAS